MENGSDVEMTSDGVIPPTSAYSPRGASTPSRRSTRSMSHGLQQTPQSNANSRGSRSRSKQPATDEGSNYGRQAQSDANKSFGSLVESNLAGSETSSPLKYVQISGSPRRSEISEHTSYRSGRSSHHHRRYRPDISSTMKHHKQIELDDATDMDHNSPRPADVPSVGNQDGPRVVIWGTNICVQDVQHRFRHFLNDYREVSPDEDELWRQDKTPIDTTLPYYKQRLQEMALLEECFLNINLHHVKLFDERLYRQIVSYPAEIIPYLDLAVTEMVENITGNAVKEEVMVRPFNAEKTKNMRGLNPEDIDQLITVSGMVIRTSSLIPEMRMGFFQCTVCRNTVEVEVDRGRIEEPTLCQRCNTNHCFLLIHNRSKFLDKQMVKLQEAPDDMPAGQTPHTVALFAHGNLVDAVQPGDRVTVTGIYRAVPLRINPRMRTVKSVYKTHVDVLHFRKTDVQRLHEQQDGSQLTSEREAQIKELSEKPDLYERLAHAVSPSIYEHEDIKKGILCLLFGGTRKDFTDTGRGHFRAELNILLCGDPGTSKSQLLQYVHGLVPRGQYTSGKGSSAVGLTAYLTKDPDTKQLVLQTGALVLSDNGICCIDEFDKMNDSTRSVLHEVMEQQTLSIAKAGIICQLNARASILAAANPVDSQWNKDKTIIENVQLPHTLLSRFDLIFLLLDPQDELYDRRLATHLVSLYYKSPEDEQEEYLDMSLLRDYIGYAKTQIHPQLTDDASQLLVSLYVKMRQVGRGQVSAFPRQLESLIRLSEALAKMRLSSLVTVADVNEAYRLYKEALKQSAVDPSTGKVDPGMLAYGYTSDMRKRIQTLAEVIRRKLQGKTNAVGFKQLLAELRQDSEKLINRETYEEALNELTKQDIIMRDNMSRIKLTFKGRQETVGADGTGGGGQVTDSMDF